jgi:hypothetical protein
LTFDEARLKLTFAGMTREEAAGLVEKFKRR